MPKIRVLIVDDAVVIRRLVSDCLATDPEIEVAGTAANGSIALAKLDQVQPDIVTLDIEMELMDGLETLAAIRKRRPRLPVIMFSTLSERGASVTLDALALGANDYVTKPANVGSVQAAMQRIREELIPKIKALCGRIPPPSIPAPRPEPQLTLDFTSTRPDAPEIIAIGVSTGGPNALAELLPAVSDQVSTPIVIVQHMPPLFTRLLAERLAPTARRSVREAVDGELLRPGEIRIAPGGFHLEVRRHGAEHRLHLHQEPPENSCRPAVDVLFRSVAQAFGNCTLAVVLTGMGQDGLNGARCVREAGGRVLVQDEATSVVWGMPGAVARAGLAAKILPLRELALEINRSCRTSLHVERKPALVHLP